MEVNVNATRYAKKLSINRFLMDMRDCRNVDSVSENYKFAYDDMPNNKEIDRTAVVAVLVSEGDHSHDFIETLTINAGLNAKFFHDKEEAVKFLKKETLLV